MSVNDEKVKKSEPIVCNDIQSVVACMNEMRSEFTELVKCVGGRVKVLEEDIQRKKVGFYPKEIKFATEVSGSARHI